MSSATTAALTPASPLGSRLLPFLQIAAAGWIGFGAFMKGWEFNPLLLPPPIMAGLQWFVSNTSVDASAFFEWSLRAVIGAECFIALAILFTSWGRRIAIATLGLFCVILVIAMIQAGLKDGIKAALAGSCGCFGKSGLPASAMLSIDAALLAGFVFLRLPPFPRRMPLWIPVVVGVVVGVAVPRPEVIGDTSGTNAGSGQTSTGEPNRGGNGSATQTSGGTSAISGPWPAAPASYDKNYFPKWAEWVGKPLRAQKLAMAIERPVPADLEKGDWLVVFSRPDCDHCQAFYREHFATKRAERVLKVSIIDTMGTPLAMPCEGCESTTLYRVKAGQTGQSPNYLIQTPVVLRVKDGIVTAVCSDVDKPDQVAAVLGAPSAPPPPTVEAQPKRTWLGPPQKFAPFYIAEFAKALGKPFAEDSFARTLSGTPPADLLSGRWIIVFYREDCDHCHELLGTYFTGKLPVRTLAISIPDADPSAILDNPCDECVKMSLAKGPNYVIGTPVVLAINDGLIECVVENAEDIPALEACLKFPKN